MNHSYKKRKKKESHTRKKIERNSGLWHCDVKKWGGFLIGEKINEKKNPSW